MLVEKTVIVELGESRLWLLSQKKTECRDENNQKIVWEKVAVSQWFPTSAPGNKISVKLFLILTASGGLYYFIYIKINSP